MTDQQTTTVSPRPAPTDRRETSFNYSEDRWVTKVEWLVPVIDVNGLVWKREWRVAE